MKNRPAYKCDFVGLMAEFNNHRAKVIMREDHQLAGGRAGEVTYTSQVQSIDFANGVMVTKNSVYLFDPEPSMETKVNEKLQELREVLAKF